MSDSADLQGDIEAVAGIEAVPAILDIICRTTGMGFAAIARVTEARWIACAVRDDIAFGLKPGGELNIETTICNEIRASGESVVIDAVSGDDVFRAHPTPALYGFESYISVPIRKRDGSFFGTLCAIDPRPAQLRRPEIIGMFEQFADLIAFHLEARRDVQAARAALALEQALSETREQFVAVLGHDLRNPLASIEAGARLLRKTADGDESDILDVVQRSVRRMDELIANVTDFARGRLGGGISIERGDGSALAKALTQVVDEFRVMAPDRGLVLDLATPMPVSADPSRIAQLLGNLIGNALTHGDPDREVRVAATSTPDGFRLRVTNAGHPIPPATRARLFEPFVRGTTGGNGLGLGLYIAAEIARAHGGTIDVESADGMTHFTFSMPAGAPPASGAG